MKLILSLSLIALAFAPGAAAQDECSESNPCPIPVSTGPAGMYFERPSSQTYNVTAGDWMYLDMFNEYDVDHELYISGYDITITAPCVGCASTAPGSSQAILFDTAGTFQITDLDADQSITLQVALNDVTDIENGVPPVLDDSAEKDAPGLGLAASLVALAAIAARRR